MSLLTNVSLHSEASIKKQHEGPTKFWAKSLTSDDENDDDDDNDNGCSINNLNDNNGTEYFSAINRTRTTIATDDVSTINTSSSTSYDYTIEQETTPQPIIPCPKNNGQVSLFEPANTTKRYQTKMLLASLIEHFCRAYGDTPDANRKVFFLICQTLRSLGIIDAEFVDEMTSVRSAFQQAFHKLFYTAVQTVRNQDLVRFDDNLPVMMIKAPPKIASPLLSPSSSSSSPTSPEPSSSTTSPEPSNQIDYFSAHSSLSHHLSPSREDSLLSNSNTRLSTSAATNSSFHSFGSSGGDFFGNLSVQNSRYNNDFVEINLLGKGGFASAFRARNKLDDIDYAVKKIRLGNDIEESDQSKENPYEKIFREIKNLARLEHQNVIRYYSSWLEYDDSSNDESGATDGSDWEEDTSRPYIGRQSTNNSTDDSGSIFRGRDPTFSDDHSASSFGRSDYSGMSHIQFGESSTVSSGQEGSSLSYSPESSTVTSTSATTTNDSSSKAKKSGWTLFIQMQLCPTTLHDYIRFRNKQYAEEPDIEIVDTRRNIEIFAQILEGTAYIHDQGLIHRDLKPSNIFLSMPNTSAYDSDGRRRRRKSSCTPESTSLSSSPLDSGNLWQGCWVPKIGDFGLAAEAIDEETGDTVLIPTPASSTPPSPKIGPLSSSSEPTTSTATTSSLDSTLLQQKLKNRPQRPKPRRTRTVGVGTRTYASPEQLAVPAQAYDEKVDIYSLGIILFELFQPFATGMERADSLDKLKRGIFPDGFLEIYPKVSALIIWMMDVHPDLRPSAHQLLEFELFSHPHTQENEDICLTLQTQLQSKVNQLERKNKEIEELKARLERVEKEKEQALQEMQQRLDAMQQRLNQFEQKEDVPPQAASNGAIKKSILSPTPSFIKKKKEVRWSTFDSIL